MECRYQARLEETKKSEVKCGFRPYKWLCDRHGSAKADKIVKRKIDSKLFLDLRHLLVWKLEIQSTSKCSIPFRIRSQPFANPGLKHDQTCASCHSLRFIQDPEFPDDREEKLYFVIINLDVSNMTELRRITQLEIEGQIDKEGLKEFVKATRSISYSQILSFEDCI